MYEPERTHLEKRRRRYDGNLTRGSIRRSRAKETAANASCGQPLKDRVFCLSSVGTQDPTAGRAPPSLVEFPPYQHLPCRCLLCTTGCRSSSTETVVGYLHHSGGCPLPETLARVLQRPLRSREQHRPSWCPSRASSVLAFYQHRRYEITSQKRLYYRDPLNEHSRHQYRPKHRSGGTRPSRLKPERELRSGQLR